jgi:hypothetical protein
MPEKKSKNTIESSLNYLFMIKATFSFGTYLGILFVLFYISELLLLFANPYEVMSPSESRYLLYNALSQKAGVFNIKWVIYDFSCWVLDRDKVIAYSLFSMWFVTFANIVSKGKEVKWGGNYEQKQTLSRLMGRQRKKFQILPFRVNLLIALIITIFACGAATSPFPKNWTSILRLFILDPLSWNIGFLAYRFAYPVLFLICILHIVIGLQSILLGGRFISKKGKVRISRHFFVLIQFLTIFFGVEYLVLKWTMASTGSLDWVYFYGNVYISIIGFFIGIAILFSMLIYTPTPEDKISEVPSPPSNWKEFLEAINKLPKYCIIPMFFALLPMSIYLFSGHIEEIWTVDKKNLTPYVEHLSGLVNKDLSNKKNRKLKKTTIWIENDIKFKSQFSSDNIYISIKEITDLFNQQQNTNTKQNASQ